MIKKLDILTDNTNLYNFIDTYYNSVHQVQIRNGNNILFQGLIKLEVQKSGTHYQQLTHKKILITNFITNIKKY